MNTVSNLSLLKVPNRFLALLKKDGIMNTDELAKKIEEDPKSILAIKGIGPKILLNLQAALEALSDEPVAESHPPVQSLGDQFRTVSAIEESDSMEMEEIMEKKKSTKDKKDKKKKDKKNKKDKKKRKDKKQKKSKKNNKKSKKTAKKNKKTKQPKKTKKVGKKKKKK